MKTFSSNSGGRTSMLELTEVMMGVWERRACQQRRGNKGAVGVILEPKYGRMDKQHQTEP